MTAFVLFRGFAGRRLTDRELERLHDALAPDGKTVHRFDCDSNTVLLTTRAPDDLDCHWLRRSGPGGLAFVGELAPSMSEKELAAAISGIPGTAWVGRPMRALAWSPASLQAFSDPVGRRLLCYARIRDGILLGSQCKLMLAHPDVSDEKYLPAIAARLAWCEPPATRSVYRDIHYVPSGHRLVVKADRCDVMQWYRPEPRIDPGIDIEQAVHDVRAVSRRVLMDELQSQGDEPFALMLSGGLDSSALAGALAEEGQDAHCTAVMMRYPGLHCDESGYQRAVLRGHRFDQRVIEAPPFDPEQHLLSRTRISRLPQRFVEPEFERASEQLRAKGVRHLWSGGGGDEVFMADAFSPLDLLATGRWREGLAQLRAHSLRDVLSVSRLHVPRALRVIRRRRSPPRWLTPAFCKESGLADHLEGPGRWPGESGLFGARLHDCAWTGFTVAAHDNAEMVLERTGIRLRLPFRDPRLIETVLNLPARLIGNADDNRRLQRAVYRPVLPAELQRRRDKVHFDYRHARDLDHPWVDWLLSDLELGRLGLVDATEVRRMRSVLLEAVKHQDRNLPTFATKVWAVIGMEVWFRGL